MIAVREGRTKVASLLLEAGADIHLQNQVKSKQMYTKKCGSEVS